MKVSLIGPLPAHLSSVQPPLHGVALKGTDSLSEGYHTVHLTLSLEDQMVNMPVVTLPGLKQPVIQVMVCSFPLGLLQCVYI